MPTVPVYSYAIGTSNPPTNLELFTPPMNPPRSRFFEVAQWLDKADGTVRGQGFPYCIWEFDTLSQDMIDDLRTICPGQSATVYITTRVLDGDFDTFTGVMLWPGQDQMEARVGANDSSDGIYRGLEFTFRRLQAVP